MPGEPFAAPRPHTFARRFGVAFLLGLAGIAFLPLAFSGDAMRAVLPPELAALPDRVLVALSLLNPLLLLVLCAAAGAATAHRVGLHSHLAMGVTGGRWSAAFGEWRTGLAAGAATGAVILLLDAAWAPWLGESWAAARARSETAGTLRGLLLGVFYGGLTEEVLLRWGLMSLATWLAWRVFQRGRGTPSPSTLWAAIIVAAAVFGASHLPAVAAMAELTPALAARTVLLNALAGVVFGWLFWRRSLEAAMLAHAGAHGVFALAAHFSHFG
jgi:hypothetical protein